MPQLLSSLRGQGGSGPQGPETTGSRGHRGWSCSWSGTCCPKTSGVPACCPAVLSPEAVCGSAQADAAPPSLGLELLDGCPGTYQALSPGQTAFLWPAPLTSSPSEFPGPLICPALVPLLHSTFPRGQSRLCKDGGCEASGSCGIPDPQHPNSLPPPPSPSGPSGLLWPSNSFPECRPQTGARAPVAQVILGRTGAETRAH